MLFREIVGQQDIISRLIRSVKEQRISHAQLFFGPEGNGKLALAIAYAQYINCESPTENDSCGECPSCSKFSKLIHPDLHFVYPVATTKSITKDPISDDFIGVWRETVLESPYFNELSWYEKIGIENKQGQISKKESEEIIRKLNLKTFEAEYKTLIMWLPEKMNVTCANKLLKMIEEPPPKTLFLLISEGTENILQTILSRTQMVKIPKIDNDSMTKSILSKFQLSEAETQDIVHLSNGNFFKVPLLIDSEQESNFNFEKFAEIMRLSYSRKIVEIVEWSEEMAQIGRERLKSFFSYCLRMMRENYVLNLKNPDVNYLTSRERQFSEKFSPFIQDWNIFEIVDQLDKASYHIERNGNGKIIILDFALKLVKLIRQ